MRGWGSFILSPGLRSLGQPSCPENLAAASNQDHWAAAEAAASEQAAHTVLPNGIGVNFFPNVQSGTVSSSF